MIFDDKLMIKQAVDSKKEEMEVLYWITEDSLYDGKTSKAKNVLTMLLYAMKFNPSAVKDGLKQIQIKRLKELTEELFENGAKKIEQQILIKPETNVYDLPFESEKLFKDHIQQNSIVLQNALETNVKITHRELDVGQDYRIDLLAENVKTAFAIEVKMIKTNHSVVSQCDKYCFYLYRKLRYDRFKSVQGVVIAPGFDEWSINELRRKGHWVFQAKMNENDLVLNKIT